MNYLSHLVYVTILITSWVRSFAQNEFATIPLDNSLKNVNKIMQFSDDQGNILFNFHDGDICQSSLVKHDKNIESQTIAFNYRNNYFLECLFDENQFILFYKDNKNGTVNVYNIGKQSSSNQVLRTNIQDSEEKHLAYFQNQGEFLVFKYSKSPFTLHSYRYVDAQYFEKESQVFHNNKRERFFLGQIMTEDEMVFVRLTMNNPFSFHLYRYFKDKGFEKKSIDIRSIYQNAGFETKVFPSDNMRFESATELSAFIQGDNIYIDMESLIHINPTFSRIDNSKNYPGILRFDWESEDSEILTFDKNNSTNFSNRCVVLLDSLYIKLLVNRNYFDLSIFDISSQKLLKNYAYNKDQKIDLIYEDARMGKTTTIDLSLRSGIHIPIEIDHAQDEIIDTKKLLKNLSEENLFLAAYCDENIIELSVKGINYKGVILDKTHTAGFVSYLLKSDLSIIKNSNDLEDSRYLEIDEYLLNLTKTNENLGNTIVYRHHESIHVAYIDKKERHFKIITF